MSAMSWLKTLLASSQAALGPSTFSTLLMALVKLWESAPSANMSRSMLGRRKAARKASMAPVAPKRLW